MPKATIFDMDGVIINSEPIHVESERLAMLMNGVEVSEKELQGYTGQTAKFMFDDLIKKHKLKITPKELADQKREFFIPALEAKGVAVPGVIDLIHRLKHEGQRLAVASSSRRTLIDFVLKKLNITSYFDAIVSADDVARSKPDPEVFLKALSALQAFEPTLKKEDCTVIEDSRMGVLAATSAGIRCIGFKNPSSGNQDLSKADLIIDDFSQF